jgi:hypothetical protein
MANNEIIGGKWTLDTTDLKAGISEANRLIRIADSEFKAAAASMGSWGNQADGLSARIKSLSTIVDVQEQKVQALKPNINPSLPPQASIPKRLKP